MSDKAARRAQLMAELAELGDDDDDDATEHALEHAIDELGHAAQAAADGASSSPAPVIIEAPAVPDPADAVKAEAAVIRADAEAQATVIEAQTDAEIRLMHERHKLDGENREAEHEHERESAVDPIAALDEALGPIELDIIPDSAPKPMHRWFRNIERRR